MGAGDGKTCPWLPGICPGTSLSIDRTKWGVKPGEGMSMRIKRITCIQLDGEFPDLGYRFVLPDYGTPLIGTILAQAGYDVKVYVEHIEPPDWQRISQSDLICFSSFTSAADRTYRLAQEIRSKVGIPTVLGGTHATYFAETCLEYFDFVALGEGDETILDLVHTLSNGGEIDEVKGIAYRVGDRVRRTALVPVRTRSTPSPTSRSSRGIVAWVSWTIYPCAEDRCLPSSRREGVRTRAPSAS